MRSRHEKYDVVVCGGGLAGLSAAVAAARHGTRVCLIQDRPVLGGNSSSEIRVTPHGAAAFHAYGRETGIISEVLIEERARNHEEIVGNGWTNSVWDLILYDLAVRTEGLTVHLNTSVVAVDCGTDRRIRSVTARVAGAESEIECEGSIFVDATGDGVVAAQAGCEWRMGSEARSEFDEPHAPELANDDVMGNTIHFKSRDTGRPVTFTPPDWAVRYDDESFFYEQGRIPYDIRSGYWWIELGVPWHTIHDSEQIRHELTRHTLGVWDWIKNRDPRTKDLASTYALEWIGQVPGKRETRRIVGQYLMTEHDAMKQTQFPDEIAFGGWFVDIHTPGGLLAATSEQFTAEGLDETTEYAAKSFCGPYGIPLGICISKDIDNLMMAGRNVSATHAALATVRVMGTTAVMGQAVGTAAALAIERRIDVGALPADATEDVQQRLLRDGCFLPNVVNADPLDIARLAHVSASSSAFAHGVGPHTPPGVITPMSAPGGDGIALRTGQWIAVGATAVLDRIELCLTNPTEQTQQVDAVLVGVEHIWDYRTDTGRKLVGTTLQVPPGDSQWVGWDVHLDAASGLTPDSYVRVDLLPTPHVTWETASAIAPGHTAAHEISPGKFRGLMLNKSFRVVPAQDCYEPANVTRGATRPHRAANLWRSDPSVPLEQWLQLTWDSPRVIGTIELTFPGHLYSEYHRYPPQYRDPQCPKDYALLALLDGAWTTVAEVSDNYQRHNRIRLAPTVRADALRIAFRSTNGDPSAGVYEVRCYENE